MRYCRGGAKDVLTCVSILLLCGCYRYVESNTLPPIGAHVELTLRDDRQQELQRRGINFVEYFTTGNGALDGIVLNRTDDSVLIRVASVRMESYGDHTLYQHISVANSDVARLRRRDHNVGGTIALAGVVGTIVTLGVLKAIGSTGDDCPTPQLAGCA